MFSRIKLGKLIFCTGSGWFSDTGFGSCPSLSFFKYVYFSWSGFLIEQQLCYLGIKKKGSGSIIYLCVFFLAPSNLLFINSPIFPFVLFFACPIPSSLPKECSFHMHTFSSHQLVEMQRGKDWKSFPPNFVSEAQPNNMA